MAAPLFSTHLRSLQLSSSPLQLHKGETAWRRMHGGFTGQAWKGHASFLFTFHSRKHSLVTLAAREAEKCKVAWQPQSTPAVEEKNGFEGRASSLCVSCKGCKVKRKCAHPPLPRLSHSYNVHVFICSMSCLFFSLSFCRGLCTKWSNDGCHLDSKS